MTEKEQSLMDKIKSGFGSISNILFSSIFPPIVEGAELIMKNVEERIMQIEKKIIKKITHLLIIGFGGVLLIFALLFFLIENLSWSYATAFFAVGIIIFVVGLMLKIGETNK